MRSTPAAARVSTIWSATVRVMIFSLRWGGWFQWLSSERLTAPRGEEFKPGNGHGDRSGRGTLELQPERRVQRHHHGGPDPQRESPGGEGKPGAGKREGDALHGGHGNWCRPPNARLRWIFFA